MEILDLKKINVWNNYINTEIIYRDIHGNLKQESAGAPGWLCRLSVRLWFRSWSRRWWVQAPRRALCWQLRAWSLLWNLCSPLSRSLSAPPLLILCLSVSQKWINVKKTIKIRKRTAASRRQMFSFSLDCDPEPWPMTLQSLPDTSWEGEQQRWIHWQ